jgi:DNA-binding transcriptional MerR regulator
MKKLFSIGEIAKKVGVAGHTIRFWTEEFEEYVPFEIGKGERRYYPEVAVEVFNQINDLIHNQGVKIRVIKEKKLLLERPKSTKITEIKQILEELLQKLVA